MTVALGRFRMDLRGWGLRRELVRDVPRQNGDGRDTRTLCPSDEDVPLVAIGQVRAPLDLDLATGPGAGLRAGATPRCRAVTLIGRCSKHVQQNHTHITTNVSQ